MHGSHHDAQKFRSSAFPLKFRTEIRSPVSATTLNFGAVSPTLTTLSCSGHQIATAKEANIVTSPTERSRSMFMVLC